MCFNLFIDFREKVFGLFLRIKYPQLAIQIDRLQGWCGAEHGQPSNLHFLLL